MASKKHPKNPFIIASNSRYCIINRYKCASNICKRGVGNLRPAYAFCTARRQHRQKHRNEVISFFLLERLFLEMVSTVGAVSVAAHKQACW